MQRKVGIPGNPWEGFLLRIQNGKAPGKADLVHTPSQFTDRETETQEGLQTCPGVYI
jgi:hypothetical protein